MPDSITSSHGQQTLALATKQPANSKPSPWSGDLAWGVTLVTLAALAHATWRRLAGEAREREGARKNFLEVAHAEAISRRKAIALERALCDIERLHSEATELQTDRDSALARASVEEKRGRDIAHAAMRAAKDAAAKSLELQRAHDALHKRAETLARELGVVSRSGEHRAALSANAHEVSQETISSRLEAPHDDARQDLRSKAGQRSHRIDLSSAFRTPRVISDDLAESHSHFAMRDTKVTEYEDLPRRASRAG